MMDAILIISPILFWLTSFKQFTGFDHIKLIASFVISMDFILSMILLRNILVDSSTTFLYYQWVGYSEELIKLMAGFFLIYLYQDDKDKDELNNNVFKYFYISALSFAILENLFYYQDTNIMTYVFRNLICNTIHISLVFISISFIRRNIILILPCYIISSFIHGIYDYFISESQLYSATFVYSLLLIVFYYTAYKENKRMKLLQ